MAEVYEVLGGFDNLICIKLYFLKSYDENSGNNFIPDNFIQSAVYVRYQCTTSKPEWYTRERLDLEKVRGASSLMLESIYQSAINITGHGDTSEDKS